MAATLGASSKQGLGHPRWIRLSHAVMALSVLTLAVTGFIILMAHPRLYWGSVGNDLTPALLELPISRNHRHGGWEAREAFFSAANSPVTAVRTFSIFNENGWGRSLHFLAAWFLVLTGFAFMVRGAISGHLRRDLLPVRSELSGGAVWRDLKAHLRMQIRPSSGGPPYGLLQKGAYCFVLFVALPLMLASGLAMSPAVGAAYPVLPDAFGGSQSARTVHFFTFISLALFVLAHVLMVVLSGFKRQLRAITLGST